MDYGLCLPDRRDSRSDADYWRGMRDAWDPLGIGRFMSWQYSRFSNAALQCGPWSICRVCRDDPCRCGGGKKIVRCDVCDGVEDHCICNTPLPFMKGYTLVHLVRQTNMSSAAQSALVDIVKLYRAWVGGMKASALYDGTKVPTQANITAFFSPDAAVVQKALKAFDDELDAGAKAALKALLA